MTGGRPVPVSGGSGHRGPHIQRVVTLTVTSYCYTGTDTGTLSRGGCRKLGRDRDLIVIRRDWVLQGASMGGGGGAGRQNLPLLGNPQTV